MASAPCHTHLLDDRARHALHRHALGRHHAQGLRPGDGPRRLEELGRQRRALQLLLDELHLLPVLQHVLLQQLHLLLDVHQHHGVVSLLQLHLVVLLDEELALLLHLKRLLPEGDQLLAAERAMVSVVGKRAAVTPIQPTPLQFTAPHFASLHITSIPATFPSTLDPTKQPNPTQPTQVQKSTFSQPFKEKYTNEVVRIW